MPRLLREAAAMAPTTASLATLFPFESLLSFVKKHELETKVIAAWLVWFILCHLQSILGPMRRRYRHWFIQYSAMAAYYLPTLVLFYTTNAVYSSDSDIKVILSMGCLPLLVASARATVSMTAFSLGEAPVKLKNWRVLPWILYFGWLLVGISWDHKPTISALATFILVLVVPLLYVLRAKPGAATLDYETKEFADYMMIESRSSPSPFFEDHAGELYDRCRYPFKLRDDQWVNFSDVLKWRGQLTEDGAVDPDIFLSYSFCRLLARRYFGFPCPEDGNAKVRDFVLRELLAGSSNKAFTIVEVQLALLHDYFFTNYHSKLTSGVLTVAKGVVAVMLRLCPWLLRCLGPTVAALAGSYRILSHSDFLELLPYVCVSAVLGVLLYTVIVQPQHPVLPSYWHPIQNLFLHYPGDDTAGSPAVVNRNSSYYWRNKMGQYSVMDDYDSRSPKKILKAWFKVHVLSQVSYSFIKHHPGGEEDVRVPDVVKTSVARTIRDMNGSPTMGTCLLLLRDRTHQEDLSWTCREDTLTHTILIWHVATCYCDMSQPQAQQQLEDEQTPQAHSMEELSTRDHKVATTLSKYCAYLVAFLPELFPEHSLTAQVVLQQVLMEAGQRKELLGGTHISVEEKTRRIQQLKLPAEEDVSKMQTFEKGVLLGRQLERQSVSLRWKTMADFWAETILYIASSSNNTAAHIQQLAQGGEFVTHLWALLCNAGIQQDLRGGTGSTA